MAISLPDARQLSDEVLAALRLRAVHGCELSFTEADVADMKGTVKAFGLPHKKEELRSLIQTFLRGPLHVPDHVMSYFLHPWVVYAAAH